MAAAEDSAKAPASKLILLPVDKDWLLDILNSKCAAKGVLKGYTCKGIEEGKGYLSEITRVRLDWDVANSEGLENLPKGVVIKQPTLKKLYAADERLKEVLDMDLLIEIHDRECRAYTFLNKHPPPPIPMALLFYFEEIKNEETGMVILEDLTEEAISLTSEEDVSKEQMFELVDKVTSLQAYGFNHVDMREYVQLDEHNPFIADILTNLESSLDQIRADHPGVFPYTNKEFREMSNQRNEACPIYAKSKTNNFTEVLAIGDLHTDNILWHRGGPNKDQTTNKIAALIDFQACHLGNCMIDICHTMVNNVHVDVRRAITAAIIERYLTQLKMKTHGDVPVTMEEAKRVQLEMLFQFSTRSICTYPEERKKEDFLRSLAGIQDALEGLKKLGAL